MAKQTAAKRTQMLALLNIPMYVELTRSVGAVEQSSNGPIHVAVQCGGSHPHVEQPTELNTKAIEDGSGGSKVMSMLMAKPVAESGTRTGTRTSDIGEV